MRHEGISAGQNYDECIIHSENEKTSKDSFPHPHPPHPITMYLVALRRWHLQQEQICAYERTGKRQCPSPWNSCPFMTRMCECELTWKQDIYRYNHIQRKSCLKMTRFNPMTDDLIREKWRHTGWMPCYGCCRDWSNSASRLGASSISASKIGKTRKNSSQEGGFGLDFNF